MKTLGKKRVKNRMSVCVILSAATFLLGSCSGPGEKISYTGTAMGTVVQQTLYVNNADKMQTEIPRQVMTCLEDLEKNVLSWREDSSEVYRVNQAADTWCELSPQLQGYLEKVVHVWEASDGALDVTVGGVTRLWDLDSRSAGSAAASGADSETASDEEFSLPDPADLREALASTGLEQVKIRQNQICMPQGFSLDLGAVGKGIACDEVLQLLQRQETVTAAVISVGGSVLTYGEKPDGGCWKVAVTHPRKSGEHIAVLQIKGTAFVATSGDYERYAQKDGIRYHHIMDPGTGYPADSGLISVTIVSDSGFLSDALSTACFVLGPDAGLALAETFGVQALMIGKDLTFYMTEGMDKLLVLE